MQQASGIGGTYGQAAKVIAWIGEANSCISNAKWLNVTALRLSMHGFLDEAVLERRGYPRIPEKKWFALVPFVDRTYLCCLWIVQEAALSMEVQLWCGAFVSFPSRIKELPRWGLEEYGAFTLAISRIFFHRHLFRTQNDYLGLG